MTPLRVVTDIPATRAGCIMGVRPCPHSRCRHWLPSVCVLDCVEERGALTLEEVGALFGLTRERIRQIEAEALGKLAKRVERGVLRAWAHASGGVASLRDAIERGRA